MDPGTGESAADWLNRAEENEIVRVLRDYGEERFARRIARAILRERSIEPITTTRRLAEIVARAVPVREKSKDPATRTFQAIRLHVNRELEELTAALPQTVPALATGGRLAVISFHSLEDRLVKHFHARRSQGPGATARIAGAPRSVPRAPENHRQGDPRRRRGNAAQSARPQRRVARGRAYRGGRDACLGAC